VNHDAGVPREEPSGGCSERGRAGYHQPDVKTRGGAHRATIVGICLLTAAVLFLTYREVALYATFYGYERKPAGSIPVKVLLISCLGVLTFSALRKTLSAWKFLAVCMAFGTIAQFGFAYTEGRGFEGIRRRALAGHGQFIADALAANDAVSTLRNYESLAARGKLGQYPRSKPPGTLLFYVLTERVSRLVVPHTYDEQRRLDRFVDFLSLVWPFVATLAVLPLYWITTMLAGPAQARLAAGFYLLAPAFNLVTLHTDQVLFPFLFLSVLSLFVWSLRATKGPALVVRGVTAGTALSVAVFCSFPLAVAAVFCLGLWLADFLTDQRPYSARIRSTAVLAGSVSAGLLVPSLVLWLTLNYNPVVRWQAALAFHAAWRKVPAVIGLGAGLSNIAEFLDWTGIPISLLALAVFWVRRADRGSDGQRQSLPCMALMAVLIGVVGYLAFFSRTVAEIARLWLFLTPVMCLVAARTLAALRDTHRWAALIMLLLQFATVYVIKTTHDFW
jgi:hypothetical protein